MDLYDIGAAFADVEDELIDSMIRNMRRHRLEEKAEKKEWTMWQAMQLEALERYKKENQKRFSGMFQDINDSIEDIIKEARLHGQMAQEIEILEKIKNGFRKFDRQDADLMGEFFKLNDRKLEALIKATKDDFKKGEHAILRMAEDKYRQTIFSAQVYANTGAGTYEKAVDLATKDFLSSGLNCIEYKNGARHTLKDYADMAIRTASKRAYLAGEGEKRAEWGIHTVIVNKRGNPCPKCLPFCGKVLIDDVYSGGSRRDGNYPLLSRAMELGLYHPRCKDSHTTYFPGISTADDTWAKKELEAIGEEYRADQKRVYADRQVEKFGRLAKYSLDPENQKKYDMKKNEWKSISNSFKYPINEDMFESFVVPRTDGKHTDILRPRNIIKKLNSNQIGKDAYRHIKENDIPVCMLYNVDNPKEVSGEYDPVDRCIYIYADKTKTILESAKTVIHEAMHDRLGHKGTRKEEVLCFLEEAKYDGVKLTSDVIKSIIKAVNDSEAYKDLPWR